MSTASQAIIQTVEKFTDKMLWALSLQRSQRRKGLDFRYTACCETALRADNIVNKPAVAFGDQFCVCAMASGESLKGRNCTVASA